MGSREIGVPQEWVAAWRMRGSQRDREGSHGRDIGPWRFGDGGIPYTITDLPTIA
jgi:hypothetical protein